MAEEDAIEMPLFEGPGAPEVVADMEVNPETGEVKEAGADA